MSSEYFYCPTLVKNSKSFIRLTFQGMVPMERREPKENAHIYISGLLSDMGRKNVESIDYRYVRDSRALQRFIGSVTWDHQPLLEELARQIGAELGEDDGVIVFDPSGHKKCGNDSVGVQRQWLGRLGKVQDCPYSAGGKRINNLLRNFRRHRDNPDSYVLFLNFEIRHSLFDIRYSFSPFCLFLFLSNSLISNSPIHQYFLIS